MAEQSKEIKAYYKNAINELIDDCNDLSLLDLIMQILYKSEEKGEALQ